MLLLHTLNLFLVHLFAYFSHLHVNIIISIFLIQI